jgi:hypothetical protein
MGSVADVYTTGDNDPEMRSERYLRHYLYCDDCGSFDLVAWTSPHDPKPIERRRKHLMTAALYSLPLVFVPIWFLLGFGPSTSFFVVGACGLFWVILVLGVRFWNRDQVAFGWAALRKTLLWVPPVVVAEILVADILNPWATLLIGVLVAGALLARRQTLATRIESLGLRCRACGATYPHRSKFFTDLEANPRKLLIASVPRPLGVSPFEVGRSLDSEEAEYSGRLPR